ncbi:hypothetical protein A8B75_10675 [Sphingomonadales bacterium EhC05]|jgi:hypothetical protein|nr:hypothetical protein A8B75_10675 [Sphingomonadales bacterium EhC05]
MPSKFVVIIQDVVSEEWRDTISDWIVNSGCLYMMAWGNDCSKWDDSVDFANLSKHDFGDIPDENSVMTTWHEKEPLSDVFWYSKFCANDPAIKLEKTIILDIFEHDRKSEILKKFEHSIAADKIGE